MTKEPGGAREIAAQRGFGEEDGNLKLRSIHGNSHKLAIRHGAPDPLESDGRPAPDGTEQTYYCLVDCKPNRHLSG